MPDETPEKPESKPKSAADLRRARQAAALRENLRKRKQQARGRSGSGSGSGADGEESAP